MPLPKTKHPLFETKLPSTGKMISYRQMIVSDEKILLMAKSSEDEGDIFRAVKQVVNNCVFESNIDNFTTFDIEWVFMKIRSTSIGNIIELAFEDKEDGQEYTFNIDLDEVEIKFPTGVDKLVKLDEDTAITLRYPPASLFDEEQAMGGSQDAYEWVASRCIDKVFSDDETYVASDYTAEELFEYIQNMGVKPYQQVKDFIGSTPHLNYVIEYTNSEGTERKLALTTLTDFFTLR